MTSFVGFARLVPRTAAAVLVGAMPAFAAAQSAGDNAGLQPKASRSYATPSSKSPASEASRGAPASVSIEGGARRMLVGATVPHIARVRDAAGGERRDVAVRWTSTDPNIASVNQFGVLTAVRPGPVTVRVAVGSLSAERRYVVESNPVKSLTLSITADQPKTGEVVEVSATAFDGNGMKVPNVPFLYTFTAGGRRQRSRPARTGGSSTRRGGSSRRRPATIRSLPLRPGSSRTEPCACRTASSAEARACRPRADERRAAGGHFWLARARRAGLRDVVREWRARTARRL